MSTGDKELDHVSRLLEMKSRRKVTSLANGIKKEGHVSRVGAPAPSREVMSVP